MKAIVNTDLNERTELPSVNAPIYNYYKKGDEVNIVDIVNGDPYEGNKVWYKLDNGRYVWSGGVEGITSRIRESKNEQIQSKEELKIDYNKAFKDIPSYYLNNGGENIRIVFIDSGVTEHDCLKDAVKDDWVVNNIEEGDNIGHGTFLSAIVGSRNYGLQNGIVGIAPKSDIFMIKAVDNIGFYSIHNVSKAFDLALNKFNADIINFSFHIHDFYEKDHSNFNSLVKDAINRNVTLVASAGENFELLNERLTVPASETGFISVGAISSDKKDRINNDQINSCGDFIMPYVNYYSATTNNQFSEDRGSSISSAIITGIISMIKSLKGKHLNKTELIDEIKNISEPYTEYSNLNDPFNIYYL